MGLVGGVLDPLFAGATNVSSRRPRSSRAPSPGWPPSASTGRPSPAGPTSPTICAFARSPTSSVPPSTFPRWTLAFVGAEPIEPGDARALRRPRSPPAASSRGAFYPCYGLAEATLMVSGPRRGSGATVADVRRRGADREPRRAGARRCAGRSSPGGLRIARRRSARGDRRPETAARRPPPAASAKSGLPARRSVRATGDKPGPDRAVPSTPD